MRRFRVIMMTAWNQWNGTRVLNYLLTHYYASSGIVRICSQVVPRITAKTQMLHAYTCMAVTFFYSARASSSWIQSKMRKKKNTCQLEVLARVPAYVVVAVGTFGISIPETKNQKKKGKLSGAHTILIPGFAHLPSDPKVTAPRARHSRRVPCTQQSVHLGHV
jgi:hypothetical protein